MKIIPVKTKIVCTMLSMLFMGVLVSFPVCSWAAFSLSATPYEGGYDLNFNTVSTKTGRVNKEMTVRVTSDIGKQYRVIQTLLDPLVNARGEKLPEGALFVYAIRGSNKYGSLNIEEQVPINWSQQVVYTSGSNGASDSFILVYGFVPVEGMSSGSYRGRIGLTLEPINSNEGVVNIVLNTLAEVEAEGVAVDIKTLRNTKEIQINSGKSDVNSSTVLFDIKNSLGRQFRIIQMVEQQPVSMEGDQLDWQSVECIGHDARKGTALSDLTPLAPKQQVIYQSSPSGDADSFTIGYVFDPNAV
ncbi:MAG: hypothetical protein PHE58_06530, partial [Candidatus Omnitrophica bacterium]|nr:hypothetical protein [Candidatus Omnitrophota bacterium]